MIINYVVHTKLRLEPTDFKDAAPEDAGELGGSAIVQPHVATAVWEPRVTMSHR